MLSDQVVHIATRLSHPQGIGMLHQDPLDFPPMTAIDNFLIGHEPANRA